MSVTTERLDLIPGTLEMARAEVFERAALPGLVGAELPSAWPPPLNDDDSMRWFMRAAEEPGFQPGWGMWYVVLRQADGRTPTIIGTCGCKTAPVDGEVEIGYSLDPEYQRQGYGSEAVTGLLQWIFEHPEVSSVIAETFPDLLGSIGVLKRNGFALVDGASEPGAIRFRLDRSNTERRM
jgi:ribosomal-protein-alanine N-acetyltransferase